VAKLIDNKPESANISFQDADSNVFVTFVQ